MLNGANIPWKYSEAPGFLSDTCFVYHDGADRIVVLRDDARLGGAGGPMQFGRSRAVCTLKKI